MAKKKKYDESEGVWRTIGGRRVFIRTGQSLSEAMRDSGKFGRREAKQKEQQEEELRSWRNFRDTSQKSLNRSSIPHSKEIYMRDRDMASKEIERIKKDMDYYNNPRISKRDLSDLEGKHIARESDYSKRRIEDGKEIYETFRQMSDREMKEFAKAQPDAIKKMQEFAKDQKYDSVEDISPMSEWSDTKGDGLSDRQRKVLDAVKSSYIYKDEKSSEKYIEDYKKQFGKEDVESAFKYYDDNYVVAKGTQMDSEGLTYNSLLKKSDYSKEALDDYVKGIDKLRNEMQYSYNSREYNQRANDLLDKLNNSKNRDYKQVDKEWTDLAKKMEKDYDEYGTTNWKDEKRLNELSRERDTIGYKKNYREIDKSHKGYTADEEDILDRFSEDYGYDKGSNLDNLVGQIDYMRNPGESIHRTAERLVEGGDFLIYNEEVKDYLRERNIKFNDDNYFEKYTNDMADKIEKLYNQGVSIKAKAEVKKQAERRIWAEKTLYEEYAYTDKQGKKELEADFNRELRKQNELEKKYGKISEEDFKEMESNIYNKANYYDNTGVKKQMSRYEESYLFNKYRKTYDYLEDTTNMSGAEILELLKKIDKDKK